LDSWIHALNCSTEKEFTLSEGLGRDQERMDAERRERVPPPVVS
jgi:hypothetical protein